MGARSSIPAMVQLSAVVIDLIVTSFGTQAYDKAWDCVTALRRAAIVVRRACLLRASARVASDPDESAIRGSACLHGAPGGRAGHVQHVPAARQRPTQE